MSDNQLFQVRPEIGASAHVTAETYQAMTAQANADPEAFWGEQARRVSWMRQPTRMKNTSFDGEVSIRWEEDGTLNA